MLVKLTGPFTSEDLREIAALVRKFSDRGHASNHFGIVIEDLTKTTDEAFAELRAMFPYKDGEPMVVSKRRLQP